MFSSWALIVFVMETWYIHTIHSLKEELQCWLVTFSVLCVLCSFMIFKKIKSASPISTKKRRPNQIKSTKVHTLKCHRVEAHISFHVFWIIWGSFQFSGRTRTWEFILRSSNWFEFIPTLLFIFNRQYRHPSPNCLFQVDKNNQLYEWIK